MAITIPEPLKKFGGPALNVGMGGFQVMNTHNSSAQGLQAIPSYAADLGFDDPRDFLPLSKTTQQYFNDASSATKRELGKVGVGAATIAIPGGAAVSLAAGAAAGNLADKAIDSAAGVNPLAEESMQALATAYAKLQSNQPYDENDVAMILKSQLNATELGQLNRKIGQGAQPENMGIIFDTMPSVVEKAETLIRLIGPPLKPGEPAIKPGESATQAIVDALGKADLSPAILLVNNEALPEIIAQAPAFSQSPRSHPETAQPNMAAGDPMLGDDGQLMAPSTPPKPAGPLDGLKKKFLG